MVRLKLFLESIFRAHPASPAQDASIIDECIQWKFFGLEVCTELTDRRHAAEVKTVSTCQDTQNVLEECANTSSLR